jgi:hypothetical protein
MLTESRDAKCVDNLKWQQSEIGSGCLNVGGGKKRKTINVSYIFITLEINKYILNSNVYILYIQYTYTLHIHMDTSGIVIHYIG